MDDLEEYRNILRDIACKQVKEFQRIKVSYPTAEIDKLIRLEGYIVSSQDDLYKEAVEFALNKGFKTVVELGCGMGFQARLFQKSGIKYLGINKPRYNQFSCPEGFDFIEAVYPCELPIKTDDVLLISTMTKGFLSMRPKEYAKLCTDFKHILVRTIEEPMLYIRDIFDTTGEHVGNWEYFKRTW